MNMDGKNSICSTCPIITEFVPFCKKWLAPASKRAWENTKYDFHAGYNKACNDFIERIDRLDVETAKK